MERLKDLKDDRRVNDLDGRLAWKLDVVGSRLATHDTEQARKERLVAESQQLQEFRRRLNEAVFRDTQFTGLDLPSNREAIRRAAVAALDVYAAPGAGDTWALGNFPETLPPPDRAVIAEGCYELLLVLSQAETTPERGLRRLDQASPLRPSPTRAYHLRRAACLERAGDGPAADRERHAADGRELTTALDHYLAGQERYERREPIAAIRHFDAALRLQPDHFWAQCLSAICWLQLRRPDAARAGFTACLRREPEFAWLYILRGFASSLGPAGSPPEEARLRSDAAEADYRQAMDLLERKPNAELRYVLLVNRGLLRSQGGDWDAAAADLKAAIQLGDLQSLASTGLADVFRKQGRFDEAIEQFSRAIEHRPDWAALYRARADVVLESKTPTPALRCRRSPTWIGRSGWRSRTTPSWRATTPIAAGCWTSKGDMAEALAACDAAIERRWRLRARPPPAARPAPQVEAARRCHPLLRRPHRGGKASPAIYERRALAREAIREFPGAIEDFTSAIALGGDRPTLLRRRGWLYIVADSPRLALHDFQEAIRLDPSSGDAHNGRGSLACGSASTARRSPTRRGPFPSASPRRISATRPPGCTPWPRSWSRPRPARRARRACSW